MQHQQQQQHHQRGNINNYIPINNRNNNNNNNASNMGGGYGGQGVKRMRGDDLRSDNVSSAHRMKWDPLDDDNNNMSYLERNDIDQRSEYTMIKIFVFILSIFFFFVELMVNLLISQ